MGQRLIVILALLLMVRPIALAENLACGEEFAIPKPIPTKEIPCPDSPQPTEIVETDHYCPCFALMQPDSAGMTINTESFTFFAGAVGSVKTAVAMPPTPPPRFV